MTAESPAGVELLPLAPDAAARLPFDEQTAFDVAAGRRLPFSVVAADRSVAGFAVLGGGALDLEIAPAQRGKGLGRHAAGVLLERPEASGALTAWSHGDHPAAAALARRFGFTADRTLLMMRMALTPASQRSRGRAAAVRSTVHIDAFRPGVDDEAWLDLNARAFANHPEQGRVTQQDLEARMGEAWFDPADFLVARGEASELLGFCWLKIEPDQGAGMTDGEVYVIGVDPAQAGRGLGRTLLNAGLSRLLSRGCRAASLYVEADNLAALPLYTSTGFEVVERHVQYGRR